MRRYAENMKAVWARHRERVHELAFLQHSSSAEVALHGAQQLASTLQRGWQLLRTARRAGNGDGDGGSSLPTSVPGPRGLQQRFMQRRAQISTASSRFGSHRPHAAFHTLTAAGIACPAGERA